MNNLTLSLVQSNLQWQQATENREILESLLTNNVDNTDLIVLPEMFASPFSMDSGAISEAWPGETVDWMKRMASTHDAAICGSIAVNHDEQRFNRLVFVTPEGAVHTYDKRHLFRMLGEDKRYAGGEHRQIIDWRGWKILPLVCYDLRFPVWSRNTADLAYDLLVYVANWPAIRNHHWQTLLEARAIENLTYSAGVNRIGRDGNNIDYIGHSMIVSASGEVLLDAGIEPGVYSISISKLELDQYRKSFPAHLDADSFDLR